MKNKTSLSLSWGYQNLIVWRLILQLVCSWKACLWKTWGMIIFCKDEKLPELLITALLMWVTVLIVNPVIILFPKGSGLARDITFYLYLKRTQPNRLQNPVQPESSLLQMKQDAVDHRNYGLSESKKWENSGEGMSNIWSSECKTRGKFHVEDTIIYW